MIVPKQTRTNFRAVVASQIGPTVAIHVVQRVPVPARDQGGAPRAIERLRQVADRVRRTTARLVDDELLRLLCWATSNQIDDPAHRTRAVEGGCHAFDDFDLPQVSWRNLQQSESTDLVTEQGQAVRQKSRIA